MAHQANLDAVLKLVSGVIGALAQQFTENDNLFEQEDPALFTSRQDASVLLPNTEGLLLKQLSLRRQFSLEHRRKGGQGLSFFIYAIFNPNFKPEKHRCTSYPCRRPRFIMSLQRFGTSDISSRAFCTHTHTHTCDIR